MATQAPPEVFQKLMERMKNPALSSGAVAPSRSKSVVAGVATASAPATPAPTSLPASVSSGPAHAPHAPAPSTGGRPPVEPPHIPGGDGHGGGGFKEWRQNNPGWALILGLTGMLLLVITLSFINDFFTERNVARLERLKQISPAPPAVAPVISTPVERVAPAQQSHDEYSSTNKRAMIGHCGRNTKELTYKPDTGCFYFDNLSGPSEKTVRIWSRAGVHSIIGEFDEKPNIVIVGPDGNSCESSVADHCESWVRQFTADSDGFRKFTIRVPQGQGFIANMFN